MLFSAARGAGEQERSNEFFSVALWSSVALSAAAWIVVLLWEVPMLRLFGGSEELLPLAQEYLVPIKFVIPLFPLNQMLAAFLRNDGSPALATGAVLAGGIFNIFGDFVFVFPMDMGIFGAGLATAIGRGHHLCGHAYPLFLQAEHPPAGSAQPALDQAAPGAGQRIFHFSV